jgi:hypothetical protein
MIYKSSSGGHPRSVLTDLEVTLLQTIPLAIVISVCIFMCIDFTTKAQGNCGQQSRPRKTNRQDTAAKQLCLPLEGIEMTESHTRINAQVL